MTDISSNKSVLTFSSQYIKDISFLDLSDEGTPVEFGQIETIQTGIDLNNKLMAWHRPIAPMFSINPIPGSKSDKELRAFLLSSMLKSSSTWSASNIAVESAKFTVPKTGDRDMYDVTMREGYLVGGSAFLNVMADGRLSSSPYRFVFKTMESNYGGTIGGNEDTWAQTSVRKGNKDIEWLYFAKINGNASARMISHPIETGAVIYDHKYLEPSKLNISVKVPLSALTMLETTFDEILRDRSLKTEGEEKTPYSVCTKSKTYKNLSLVNYSHDEIPDAFDMIDYTLSFQELMFSSASGYKKASDPGNSDRPTTAATGMRLVK